MEIAVDSIAKTPMDTLKPVLTFPGSSDSKLTCSLNADLAVSIVHI